MSVQDAIDILYSTKTGDKGEARKTLENYVLESTKDLEDAQKRVNQQYKKSSELSKSILGDWENTNNVLKFVANQQYSVLIDSVAWLKKTSQVYILNLKNNNLQRDVSLLMYIDNFKTSGRIRCSLQLTYRNGRYNGNRVSGDIEILSLR